MEIIGCDKYKKHPTRYQSAGNLVPVKNAYE